MSLLLLLNEHVGLSLLYQWNGFRSGVRWEGAERKFRFMRCSFSTINLMMKDDVAGNQGINILACPFLVGVLTTRKLSMAADPLHIVEQ